MDKHEELLKVKKLLISSGGKALLNFLKKVYYDNNLQIMHQDGINTAMAVSRALGARDVYLELLKLQTLTLKEEGENHG